MVAPISIDDLLDLNRLRCDVEEVALRRSVAEGDAGWEASVLAAAHRLRRTAIVVDGVLNPDWSPRHAAFHLALVSGSGSPRLLALHSRLYQQLERYRLLAWGVAQTRDIDAEHQALVDAALDRDADELVRAARARFERTVELIVDAARNTPETARA